MTISYRTPPGSGVWTVLASEENPEDGLAEKISGYQATGKKQPFESPAYGQPTGITQDMGNLQVALSFFVDRMHGTADAALQFINMEALRMSAAGNFDVQILVGSETVWLANTVWTEMTPDPASDQSSRIKYGFTGGLYTDEEP